MLSQTAAPATTPEAKKGLLAGMRMDLRIDTAPDVQFRTALAQNLEAEAHMRLRGTPSRPGILGRIGLRRLKEGKTTDAVGLNANYVRRSDAEIFWKGGAAHGH